jgi:hypothetical protein
MDKLTIKNWDEPINEKQMDSLCEIYDLLLKFRTTNGHTVMFPNNPEDELPFMLSLIKQELDILIRRYIDANNKDGASNYFNRERCEYYLSESMENKNGY